MWYEHFTLVYNAKVDAKLFFVLCNFLYFCRDLLKDTHTDGVKSTSYHVSRLVFLFSCSPNPSINHLNFYCIKQIDNIFLYVYCNRSQKTSQRVKNNSHATRLRLVSYFFYWDVICDLLQCTHTEVFWLTYVYPDVFSI